MDPAFRPRPRQMSPKPCAPATGSADSTAPCAARQARRSISPAPPPMPSAPPVRRRTSVPRRAPRSGELAAVATAVALLPGRRELAHSARGPAPPRARRVAHAGVLVQVVDQRDRRRGGAVGAALRPRRNSPPNEGKPQARRRRTRYRSIVVPPQEEFHVGFRFCCAKGLQRGSCPLDETYGG